MVFHSEYSSDYLIYITTFHLRGRFDLEKLQAAIAQSADRHPMLRTSFDLNNFSAPLQFVHRRATIPVEIEDLRHFSAEEQDQHIVQWIETEKHRRFEWSGVPLLRVHIHRRGEDSFQFSLSEPFLDGWSVASLITEIFERYSSLLKGDVLPATSLQATYADFVDLEQQTIASEDARRYWSEKFSDANASRITGTSLLRQPSGTPRVGRMDVPVANETSSGLHELAAANGLSIKHVLLYIRSVCVWCSAATGDVWERQRFAHRLRLDE